MTIDFARTGCSSVEGTLVDSGLARVDSGREARAETIDGTDWSHGLAWSDIEALAGYMSHFSAPAGAVILREGCPQPFLGLVASGQARVEKCDSSGQARVLADVRIGRCFGEMALIDGQPTSAAVVAEVETGLLILDRASFDRLMEERPELALVLVLRVARLLSQKLRATSGRLVDYLHD